MDKVTESKSESKSQSVIEVLERCKAENIPCRMVGKWCWCAFTEKPSAAIRQSLLDMGFHWSHRRQQWSNSFGHSSKPARGYRPWDKYQTVSLDEAISRRAVTV